MLELEKGYDILQKLGGIETIEQARGLFKEKVNAENQAKLEKIKTEEALIKIANAIAVGDPSEVFVNNGSDADKEKIRRFSIEKGEEKSLAKDGHTIHFDLPEEQARIVDRTYYITNPGEDVSVLSKNTLRDDAYEYLEKYFKGIMQGKRLLVGFFS